MTRGAVPASFLCSLALLALTLPGQGVLVLDINATAPGASSNPENIVAAGGIAFFIADDGVHGREVWYTDVVGATLAADIMPGPATSNPGGLLPFLGGVLTVADDGVHGRELHWVTRGYSVPIDINAGPASTPLGFGVVYGAIFYVVASTPATGFELWATDVTSAWLVRDIVQGPGDGAANYAGLAVVNGHILFNGTDPLHGMELWSSDGTAQGTVLVKDVCPGTVSGLGSGRSLVSGGSVAFFAGNEPATGLELWVSDGTTSGTRLVSDLVPGAGHSQPEPMLFHDGWLWLRAQTPATGTELFRSLASGPVTLVKDITPGPASTSITTFRGAGDLLFFATGSISTGSQQIQRSDGTAAGTFAVRGGLTYPLMATDWIDPVGIGTRILFQGVEGGQTGNEPWLSDGTLAGTARLLDLEPGAASSLPRWFTVVGDKVVFAATQAAVGTELFAIPLAPTRGCIVETLMPGCAGPNGRIPELTGAGIPRFGSSFSLQLSRAAANTPGGFVLSLSGNPGVGGCALQVGTAASSTVVVTSPSGAASMPLAVPNNPTLLSFQLFAQAAVLQAGGGFLGQAALSNGLRIVVGDS